MNFSDGLKFLQEGIREKTTVGAIWPSSPALCARMAEPVLRDRSDAPLRILEVGAGLGPVSEILLPQLRAGDAYDIVELNPNFCAHLRARFGGSAVEIHELSILDWPTQRGAHAAPYDRIVSGLPLANFPADLVEQVYRTFFRLLEPDGFFVMFEYLVIRQALATVTVGAERRRVRRILEIEEHLRPLQREQIDILTNVPPARVRVRGRPAEPGDFVL